MSEHKKVEALEQLVETLLRGEPYFGELYSAKQIWPARQPYMIATVKKLVMDLNRPLEILEVGSWVGHSALIWVAAARKLSPQGGKILCIDHWEPYLDLSVNSDEAYQVLNETASKGIAHQLFLHNVRCSGLAEMVKFEKGNSRDVLPKLPDNSFDLIYLDGGHTYGDLSFDIAEAKRIVRDGGVICGDDLELPKAYASQENHPRYVEQNIDYVQDAKSGIHYHPGVSEAVSEAFAAVGVYEEGYWAALRLGDDFIPLALS